jgi:transketolase
MVFRLGSTRESYGKALLKLGKNKKVVVLDSDTSFSTRSMFFAKKYPNRFFNMGISEQDMVGTAAGLAFAGKIVYLSTYSCFLARAWEQIRNVCHDKPDLKIVGTHAGFSNPGDGFTHQSLEDIAIMKVIPNMSVIVPADTIEAEQALISVSKIPGPFFIRLGRLETPVIFDSDYKFEYGKIKKIIDGNDATIFATGSMLSKAIEAADNLKREKINVSVFNVSTIKPLDPEIVKEAKKTGAVVTAEEHSIIGGLGESISSLITEHHPIVLKKVGVKDKFGTSARVYETYDLHKKYGLTSIDIIIAVKDVLAKKKGLEYENI